MNKEKKPVLRELDMRELRAVSGGDGGRHCGAAHETNCIPPPQ